MKIWLELNISWFVKPTYANYITTYHQTIQWRGKLTGNNYHEVGGVRVQGNSPLVKEK
jgi:hypothetical protein